MTLRVASLCTGYGGLELALAHAGIDHDLAWWSEIDPAAAAVMAAHTTAPNLGDLCAITDPPPVDLVTAGFPCQPVSLAGARRGVDDERWLIRDVVAVWRASGARWLLLENVWGLLTANNGRAFAAVLDALAEVGAAARWACLRAADVGAPHGRLRWFCVAHADGQGRQREGHPEPGGWPGVGVGRGQPAPDTDERGRQVIGISGLRQDSHPQPWADADRCGSAGTWGQYAPAVDRWAAILGRPAPRPTVDGRLNPRAVEWMMGLPAGWVTDCGLSRTRALHVLGNGVVPQQAAAALAMLKGAR